ncbi:hypothetical protein NPX13_g8893 [Xylaria arbuscula]|uniref:Pfs domain protein n=1 Tax=Xylaria arbuscula TaxID=114810 RepID=A0A9W8N7J7_9PEZI|nr:hypothetical protein NPX13_g8893 [Xylaria arbuscula]
MDSSTHSIDEDMGISSPKHRPHSKGMASSQKHVSKSSLRSKSHQPALMGEVQDQRRRHLHIASIGSDTSATLNHSTQEKINFTTFTSARLDLHDSDDNYLRSNELDYSVIAILPLPNLSKPHQSSYRLLEVFWKDCLTSIGEILIEETGARAWIRNSLGTLGIPGFENGFHKVLSTYGLIPRVRESIIISNNNPGLLEKYGFVLCRYFWQKALSGRAPEIPKPNAPWTMGRIQLCQAMITELYWSSTARSEYMSGQGDAYLSVIECLEALIEPLALRNFATVLRRTLYFDDFFAMVTITRDVELQFPSDRRLGKSTFTLDWNPVKFIESQFGGDHIQIGSLVTLTGATLYSQATTYRSENPDAKVILRIERHQTLNVIVCGTKEVAVEVAQQLSWLSAALSISPFKNAVAYCNPLVVRDMRGPPNSLLPQFMIHRSFAKPPRIGNSCWLSLFSDATIAWGFPIPRRGSETGLEISLELLATIAGVHHAVEYDGGVVMKGFSSMLIPMKLDTETNTVQWHAVFNDNEDTRLSYQDGIDLETRLGQEDVSYENIDYSTALEVRKPFKIQSIAVGFQQFGTGQVEFTLGPKDGTRHFQRQGPYRQIVNASEITPIVLFDTLDRRGWLVPASGVLLHVAQHRKSLDPSMCKMKMRFEEGASFRDVLLQNESTKVYGKESYRFNNMIAATWSILEFLLDQRYSTSNSSGLVIKSPFSDSLEGYEFKAVVENRAPFKTRQVTIEKTSGGWPSLVRHIDALVLFAEGFEDVIKPTQGSHGLCHNWKTVPKDKDYLATTVKMLNGLYDVAGCRLSRQYLTSSHLQWHRGNSALFERCPQANSLSCNCHRLQQILPKKTFTKVIPPGPLEDEGGIIFGKSNDGSQVRWKRKACTEGEQSIYGQPNVTFKFRKGSLDSSEEKDKLASEQYTHTTQLIASACHSETKQEPLLARLHTPSRTSQLDD